MFPLLGGRRKRERKTKPEKEKISLCWKREKEIKNKQGIPERMTRVKRFSWALNFTKNRFKKVRLAVPRNTKIFLQMLHKSSSPLQGGINFAKQRRGFISSIAETLNIRCFVAKLHLSRFTRLFQIILSLLNH